jgi:hypothetical protein
MSYSVLLVAPLVLASFVMLLAFVGCGLNAEGEEAGKGPKTYKDLVIQNDYSVGYWRLGERQGPTADDSKDGHDGEYKGTVTFAEPGLLAGDSDTAVKFDGSTGYVSVPYNAELNPAKFTVEAIVNGSGSEGLYGAVVSSRDEDGDAQKSGYILYATPEQKWEAWVGDGSVGDWQIASGGDVKPDKHYLAMTYDGTTLKLYVDPTADTPGVAVIYVPQTANELRIGAGRNELVDPQYFFNGVIDEVAVYNVDLDFSVIQKHFEVATKGPET